MSQQEPYCLNWDDKFPNVMNNVDEEDEDGHKEERVNSVYTKKILKYCFLEDNLHLTILDKADLEIFAN